MEGWMKMVKEYALYQKSNNSMWCTDMPIFCEFTKKQIYTGYIIASHDSLIGFCCIEYFLNKLRHKIFTENEYIYIRGIESSAEPVKKTIKIERGKMSVNLRYKILKRDRFRCVACGAKAGDVELQIDHIIPVSKGGKTEEKNLQSLCRKCNIGKSNVY